MLCGVCEDGPAAEEVVVVKGGGRSRRQYACHPGGDDACP